MALLNSKIDGSHKFSTFELEALSAKIGKLKPKRGRPRKKT